jgi:hypothetical protein
MDDRFFAKFQAADVSEQDWNPRLAVIRRTRRNEQGDRARRVERPELIELDEPRVRDHLAVWDMLQARP